MALTDKLTAIGDAIREKTGGTEKLTLDEMPTQIQAIQTGGGGDLPEEALVISGNCIYRFANGGWDWFIEKYGNRVTTSDITNANYMFDGCEKLKEIPFDINFNKTNIHYCNQIFANCYNLISACKINNLKAYDMGGLFQQSLSLREIPPDYADTWDWSYLESQTSPYSGKQNTIFYQCNSLRTFPINIIKSGNPYSNYSYSYFYNGFYSCYSLDELIDLPIPYTKATWTSNAFNSTFTNCYRLKNITFALNDDTPISVNWKSQVISLNAYTGYADGTSNITKYNNGITADKEVEDDATYQALKNDPDWFTSNVAYSRYNHDSAVATINSLPDTSAYLATAGGTNTIKFKGASGANTDGGAINTLTEEEIAVATAKGWTVTLV